MTHVPDADADIDSALSTMVDVSFATAGGSLPSAHRRLLADALERALPWLAGLPDAGVHRLQVAADDGAQALLSRRTRLTLRVPRERADALKVLVCSWLPVGPSTIELGAVRLRELVPHGALYAHLVAADDADELAFLAGVEAELKSLGVRGRPICGRHRVLEAGALQGFGLMLDGLSQAAALRLLEAGIGRHRRLGCGVFVPHKSSVAVGA